MTIEICVGSTCHVYGSYEILTYIRNRLKEEKLQDRVRFKSAFCMGNCPGAVCMRIDGERFDGIRPDNAEEFFATHIMSRLSAEGGEEQA